MPTVVLDMMDRRPIWAMPEWVPAEIAAALPPDWGLVVIEEEADGSGDGVARVSPAVLEAVSVASVYLGYGVPVELLHAGERLEWVHSGGRGGERPDADHARELGRLHELGGRARASDRRDRRCDAPLLRARLRSRGGRAA